MTSTTSTITTLPNPLRDYNPEGYALINYGWDAVPATSSEEDSEEVISPQVA